MNMENMFSKHECVVYIYMKYDMAIFKNCDKYVLNAEPKYNF